MHQISLILLSQAAQSFAWYFVLKSLKAHLFIKLNPLELQLSTSKPLSVLNNNLYLDHSEHTHSSMMVTTFHISSKNVHAIQSLKQQIACHYPIHTTCGQLKASSNAKLAVILFLQRSGKPEPQAMQS